MGNDMGSDGKPGEFSDIHENFGSEYRGIDRYLSNFQVKLGGSLRSVTSDIPNITVFKRKNLDNLKLLGNIYHQNIPTTCQLRGAGSTSARSKVSCVRCRKYKKKCSREFPECSNCTGSEELCTYLPRKKKVSTIKAKLQNSQNRNHDKRLSLPNLKVCEPDSNGINDMNTNYSYQKKKHGNDLDMILN